MSSSTRMPLYLFQVLEEEFISLHSVTLESEQVPFPDPNQPGKSRDVTANLSWQFHPTHIKNPRAFIAELLRQPISQISGATLSALSGIPTQDWTKNNLTRDLRHSFGREMVESLRKFGATPAQPKVEDGSAGERVPDQILAVLTDGLNAVLSRDDLYQSDRFSSHWLTPESRNLVIAATSGVNFTGEDLVHFNRLLLEDAFPDAFERIHDIRLAAMYKRLHRTKQKALCLSGGGIRSGTFALGLLQGMARHDLIGEFDYLSTVSGGGYIGSWLTAWIHRHPKGLKGVTRELANNEPASKIDPDSAPIRHLRSYSNFITPQVGLLTADTWTFVGIYLRNLFLNWLVFIPLIVAVLTIPRINLAAILAQPPEHVRVQLAFSLFNMNLNVVGRHVFLGLGFLFGAWALAYVTFNRPGVREELRKRRQFWRARSDQRSFLIYCLLPLVGSAFCLTTYWGWTTEDSKFSSIPVIGLFGAALAGLAWVIGSLVLRRFRADNRQDIDWRELVVLLITGFVGGCLLGLVSLVSAMGAPVMRVTKPPGSSFAWTSWSDSQWTWMTWTTELYACLAVPVFLLTFLLAATFFVGVSSDRARVDDEDREWWARLGAWVFIAIIGWSVANVLVIFGPIALLSAPKTLASIGGVSGLIAILLGRSAKTSANEEPGKKSNSSKVGLIGSLIGRSLPLLSLVFIAALLAALSLATTGILQGLALLNHENPRSNLLWVFVCVAVFISPLSVAANGVLQGLVQLAPYVPRGMMPGLGIVCSAGSPVTIAGLGVFEGVTWLGIQLPRNLNNWLTTIPAGFGEYLKYIYPEAKVSDVFTGAKIVHMNVLHQSSIWYVAGLGGTLFVLGMMLSRFINLNLFSLHAGYRNRLIRAFLGASRLEHERRPNPFTGFDPLDNIAMHELRPALFDEDDFVDPVRLVNLLLDPKNDLSQYLARKHLLNNIKAVPNTTTVSQRLIASLRRDLNGALQDQDLPNHSTVRTVTKEELVAAGSARSIDHILLNRSVLEQAYPNMIRPLAPQPEPYKLMPVINTTLNLVGGDNLAWQQRKAEPFTMTPLHSGCFRVGYRDSREYGGSETGGISIGTAAAISGAAASSNMGYYTTSPVLSLLLTFFNVRLGWWLGNPGPAGEFTYQLRAPKYSVKPVVDEALGFTDDRNKYVYLSDGGHFENLALYEMVLRRCHVIVVSDGAQDQDYRFTDLGNAIRKIRIDLGVPIEFWTMPIRSGWLVQEQGLYWAIGRIRYSCIDGTDKKDGLLLYIKPAVYGTEPRDVLEYKKSFPDFPHQTTADQFFDEPQFESYRVLGSYIMEQICGSGNKALNLHDMIERAVNKLVESEDTDSRLEKWARAWLK